MRDWLSMLLLIPWWYVFGYTYYKQCRYLQCHHGVWGKDPAGDPGCLNVSSDVLLGKGSFNVGSLASTWIALRTDSFVEGLTMLLILFGAVAVRSRWRTGCCYLLPQGTPAVCRQGPAICIGSMVSARSAKSIFRRNMPISHSPDSLLPRYLHTLKLTS